METDDAPLSPLYRAVGFFRLFCHTVVLTLAFAYVFVKMQILEPVRLLKIPLKIPPLPVLLAAALLLVCCTGLARHARGIWGLLGLYLSPLLLFAFLTSFHKYISGLHGDAVGAVAFMAGLFVTPVLMLIFGIFGISLNCVLLSLKKNSGEVCRLPDAGWHKPVLVVCLTAFFPQRRFPTCPPHSPCSAAPAVGSAWP